jgi:hypothetical protein
LLTPACRQAGIGAGFLNVLCINALQTANYLGTVTKSHISNSYLINHRTNSILNQALFIPHVVYRQSTSFFHGLNMALICYYHKHDHQPNPHCTMLIGF